YSTQEILSVPIEKHDISMDAIITEKFIYDKA
ncbi:MAG: 5-formyltetrahydrofolate cyclo-ligase, partial [Pelagibacterales bacterium]|nr:5-formyltetrahydrofolate cyclo-ligase [Pelagibacterales bacterium]